MGAYATLYYAVIACGIAAVPYYFSARAHPREREIRTVIVYLIGVVYLLAAFRTRGADMEAYHYLYEVSPGAMFDLGFRLMLETFRSLGLPFTAILLVSSIASLYALKRLSDYYQVDVGLLMLVWFAHIAAGRDLSQLRTGFAIAVCLIGITLPSRWARYAAFAVGISLHYSAAAFVVAYEVAIWIARRKSSGARVFWLCLFSALAFALGQMISYLGFLDPRIEIYLNWREEGYGEAGFSYTSLALHLAIALLAWLTREKWSLIPQLTPVFYLQIFGLVTLLAFAQAAIFSGRLSNVVFSLYPVLLIHALQSVGVRVGGVPAGKLASGVLALVLFAVLVTRPVSFMMVNMIGF